MKIKRLRVQNFRAINELDLVAGTSMIVIAGPNGCGKSCVLDAIRFIKSTYGGYTPNEWDQWFNEFQIQRTQDPRSMRALLRDRGREAILQATVSLHGDEKQYIRDNLISLAEEVALSQLLPGTTFETWSQRVRVQGQKIEGLVQQVQELGRQYAAALAQELQNSQHVGTVTVSPSGRVTINTNFVHQTIWRIYQPGRFGLLDYHGAHRNYSRERLGGVDLSLKTQEEQQKQSILYNYGSKYANIKSQMAAEYVLEMLRQQGGAATEGRKSLSATLGDLVRQFFPGKTFEGVRSNEAGELEFSVVLGDKQKHDINELSSGEKEILFGYLRLRNSAQRHSVVLLDEPELHLNPKLIQGLPQFYQKYIGEELDNQIWTVTHSDAFLREALQSANTRVFHMREARQADLQRNQIQELKKDEEIDDALLELIGDIAGYRPGGKVVIFEGENSDFDVRMVGLLFPAYERRMNFVSAGNRRNVRRLHDALEKMKHPQDGGRIFSIVDRDNEEERGRNRRYQWDVYHIENYLLDSDVILGILRRIHLEDVGFESAEEVDDAMRTLAEAEIDGLVEHVVRERAFRAIHGAIKLRGGDDDGSGPVERVTTRIGESLERLRHLGEGDLSASALEDAAAARKRTLIEALEGDRWKREFRGKDILKAFARDYGRGIKYEIIRDMIVVAMAERGIRPPGMLAVLERIDKYSDVEAR